MKIKPISLFILVAVLSWGNLFAQQSDENNLLKLAQTYEQAAQYETALRYYNDLFVKRPANGAYFEGVRRMLTQLKRYDELVALLRQRVEKFPADLMTRAYLGSAYYRSGNETEAKKTWEDVMATNASNTAVYRMVADQAIDNRLYSLAVEYLLRARKAGNNDYIFVPEIARAYALQLKFKEALQEYVNLLVSNPTMLGEVQRQLVAFTTLPEGMSVAREVVREACDDHDTNVQLRQLLAWITMEAKDYAAAFEVYREIEEMQERGGGEMMNFARRAYEEKAYSIARKAFLFVKEKFGGARYDAEATFYSVRCTESMNDYADSVATAMPMELKPSITRGSEAIPNYSGVVAQYESIAQKYPQHPVGIEAMYRIGYVKFHRFSDADGALETLAKCQMMMRQILGRPDADMLMGEIYVSQGKLDRARAQYTETGTLNGLTADQRRLVDFAIAELDYFEAKFDDAYEKLTKLAENSSADIANDALMLSMLILENRKPTDAPLAQFARAALLERQRKYSEAAALLRDLIAAFPSAMILDRAFIALAIAQRKSGQEATARTTLETFLTKYPDSILRDDALFHLADISSSVMNDAPKAVELYQQLLKDFPNSLRSEEARRRILLLRESKQSVQ